MNKRIKKKKKRSIPSVGLQVPRVIQERKTAPYNILAKRN
jgi:hypothetical protein